MKLKHREIPDYRERQLKRQNYICPLCGNTIHPEDAVLDHDHSTGKVRKVLHRSCNQTEGRILSWIKRSRSDDPRMFIKNLTKYWRESHDNKPEHPSHKTETEKEIRRLQKKRRRVKTDRKKKELDQEIKSLKDTI